MRGKPGGIRSCGQRVAQTAVGPWIPGRLSRAGSSTAASGLLSEGGAPKTWCRDAITGLHGDRPMANSRTAMVRIAEHETHRLPAVKQPPCEVAWVGRGSRGGRQAGPQQFENQSIAVKPRERIP